MERWGSFFFFFQGTLGIRVGHRTRDLIFISFLVPKRSNRLTAFSVPWARFQADVQWWYPPLPSLPVRT